jgi:hypothetical protein
LTLRQRNDLNDYHPSWTEPQSPDASAVIVRTPAGTRFDITAPALAAELGEGVRVMKLNRGTFDTMPLSLITTRTVESLGALLGTDLNVLRFRPNLVIEAFGAAAYPEENRRTDHGRHVVDSDHGRDRRVSSTSTRSPPAAIDGAQRYHRPGGRVDTGRGRPGMLRSAIPFCGVKDPPRLLATIAPSGPELRGRLVTWCGAFHGVAAQKNDHRGPFHAGHHVSPPSRPTPVQRDFTRPWASPDQADGELRCAGDLHLYYATRRAVVDLLSSSQLASRRPPGHMTTTTALAWDQLGWWHDRFKLGVDSERPRTRDGRRSSPSMIGGMLIDQWPPLRSSLRLGQGGRHSFRLRGWGLRTITLAGSSRPVSRHADRVIGMKLTGRTATDRDSAVSSSSAS